LLSEHEVKTIHQAPLRSLAVALAALAIPRPAAAYDKSAFVAPEGEALVVLIQNEHDDRALSFVVFDPNKQCVAEVGGRSAYVTPMKPGTYTWFVTGSNTHRLELELEAGRTYFIRLYSVDRFATRVLKVTLIRRVNESYMQLKTWLHSARVVHARDDRCRGKPLKERSNRTNRRINEANADWKNGGDLYQSDHTMIREDGLTAKEIDWL
jgi:hypothetical protein